MRIGTHAGHEASGATSAPEPPALDLSLASPSPRFRPAEAPEAIGAQAGPALSFDDVYDAYVDFVWQSARRLGVSEAAADDVVQQTFVVVHRRLLDFEGRSSLRTWIFSVLLRVVREHRRSMRRKSPHWMQSAPADPDELPDDAREADPFEALSRAEAARVIEELLESLDEDKREVFVLAELEQMTAPEIAEVTGLVPRAVYSRLRAARTDFERAVSAWRRRALGRKP